MTCGKRCTKMFYPGQGQRVAQWQSRPWKPGLQIPVLVVKYATQGLSMCSTGTDEELGSSKASQASTPDGVQIPFKDLGACDTGCYG